MELNLYLTYYNTFEEAGQTYYRLKAVFLPTDFVGDILLHILRLTGSDISNLLNIATIAPDTIAQGTEIWSIAGTAWEAPADLYRLYTTDMPRLEGTPIGDIGIDVLLGHNPYIIYAESLPPFLLPQYFPEEAHLPLLDAISHGLFWAIPYGYTLTTIIAAAGYSDYPAWSTCTPLYYYLFQGCDYVYDDDFRKLHISLAMAYYHFDVIMFAGLPTNSWRHDGRRFLIDCCNTDLFGFPITVVQEGYLRRVQSQMYIMDEPAFIFPESIPHYLPLFPLFKRLTNRPKISAMSGLHGPDYSDILSRRFKL